MASRYLVTGAGGMLGTDLMAVLADRDSVGLTRDALDVTDEAAVRDVTAGFDVVINAAAFTRVDDAETHEAEAYAVNATAAGVLARAAAAHGAAFVQLSTDYVFDGRATSPYSENEPLDPVSAYGRTKAAGERLAREGNPRAYIVRTAWLYGEHGSNFARTMLRLAAERESVDVVADQVGQPTWSADLATRILAMLDADAAPGIYHATNSGEGSWFDFAREVFELGGYDPARVKPTESAQFQRPAPRPAYSVLGHDAWRQVGLAPMRNWRTALRDAFHTGALGAA